MRPADLARRAASTARLAVLALTPARVLRARIEREHREDAAYLRAAERGLQTSARRRQAEEDGAQPRRGASEHRHKPMRDLVAATDALGTLAMSEVELARAERDAATADRDVVRRERATERAGWGEDMLRVQAERDRLAVELREADDARTSATLTAREHRDALERQCERHDAADARASAATARADRLHAALGDATRLVGAVLATHTVRHDVGNRAAWRPQTVPDGRFTEWAAEHDRLGMVARDDAPPVGAETEEVARG